MIQTLNHIVRMGNLLHYNIMMCVCVCVCGALARSKNLISRPAVIAYTVHITYTLIMILRHCVPYDTRARF